MNRQNSFAFDWAGMINRQPDETAILVERNEETVCYTYKQLDTLMCRSLKLFADKGLSKGDIIISMLPNSVEAMACFLAAVIGGYGYAPLPCTATEREIDRWQTLLSPRLFLVKDGLESGLLTVSCPLMPLPCDGTFSWLPEHKIRSHETGARVYLSTSGSTGEPKAIVIDADTLWASGRAFAEILNFSDKPVRFWNYLPMSYLGGLFNLGMIPLCCGGSVLITEQFSGKAIIGFLHTVERFHITALWFVPTIVQALLGLFKRIPAETVRAAFDHVEVSLLGTAPIELEAKRRFEEMTGLSLLENYALSETTFLTSERPGDLSCRVQAGVGTSLPYAELRLTHQEEYEGGAGELSVKTPYLFLGYLTADGKLDLPVDDNGFMATGDIGYFDQNRQLVLTGRKREIIKKGGNMIALREIELLATQMDGVVEAAAVPVKHAFYGESYVLYVVAVDSDIKNSLTSFLHKNLVNYKWPDEVRLIDALPKTSTGKIRKALLGDSCERK